jgi:chromate transporter
MYNTPVEATQTSGGSGAATATTVRLLGYFLRLGAVGFGGPVALAARMQRELVDERGWIADEDYLDGLAFAQLAPGPLAAQLAMYLGYVSRGVVGCTAAGLGFVLPSFLMVLAIAAAYSRYGGLTVVQALFYGIGPATIGVMGIAAGRLAGKTVKRDPLLVAIYAAAAGWTAILQRELVAAFVAAGVLTAVVRAGRSWRLRGAPAFLPFAWTAPVSSIGLLPLLLFFARAGMFVFGSGLAIVPFLYDGVVREHSWLNDRQFLDAIAVAMITPGPVVIAVAFIGFLVAGVPGAVVSALGIFAPAYLMVVIVAPLFRQWVGRPVVRSFVAGVTAAAAGGITGAAIVLAHRSIHDGLGALVAGVTILVLTRFKIPEPAVIAAGGIVGVIAQATQ